MSHAENPAVSSPSRFLGRPHPRHHQPLVNPHALQSIIFSDLSPIQSMVIVGGILPAALVIKNKKEIGLN